MNHCIFAFFIVPNCIRSGGFLLRIVTHSISSGVLIAWYLDLSPTSVPIFEKLNSACNCHRSCVPARHLKARPNCQLLKVLHALAVGDWDSPTPPHSLSLFVAVFVSNLLSTAQCYAILVFISLVFVFFLCISVARSDDTSVFEKYNEEATMLYQTSQPKVRVYYVVVCIFYSPLYSFSFSTPYIKLVTDFEVCMVAFDSALSAVVLSFHRVWLRT
jgi:hypothetical protein